MTKRMPLLAAILAFATLPPGRAQEASITVPPSIPAGSAFSIGTSGTGRGTIYITGLGQTLKKNIQLGNPIAFSAGSLVHAGRYIAIVTTPSGTQNASFDVIPLDKPAKISFLSEPSRLPVDLQDGITGTVYVFDSFGNLIVTPTPVSFELKPPGEPAQHQTITTQDGAAWVKVSTTAHRGIDTFNASAGDINVSRFVRQVAGDPCQLSMNVHQSGGSLQLQTAPVRDCSGNPVPDGTIITFSESYDGGLSTADVPLKHGIATVELPAHPGGVISVASGVVLGNQIRWGK